MKNRQRGMTFLGLLILVTFVGLFVYAGIRLTPAYLEYMKVARVLEDLKTEVAGGVSAQSIRRTLERRFDIESINDLDYKDVEVAKDGDVFVVRATYEVATPFVANVSFLVTFDKTVEVPAG